SRPFTGARSGEKVGRQFRLAYQPPFAGQANARSASAEPGELPAHSSHLDQPRYTHFPAPTCGRLVADLRDFPPDALKTRYNPPGRGVSCALPGPVTRPGTRTRAGFRESFGWVKHAERQPTRRQRRLG